MKKTILLSIISMFLFCMEISAQTLNVATFNVRVIKDSDTEQGNDWVKRCPKICELIKFHDFDILGCQEVTRRQLKDLSDSLDGYGYIGVSRDNGLPDGEGEFVPVFYKLSKFKLLESGTFWLAPYPDAVMKGWDAECFRICTWGKFLTSENKILFFFNTHLDHRGAVARHKSAILIILRINRLIRNTDCDVVLAGDMNSGDHTDVYRTLNTTSYLTDCAVKADIKYNWVGTANNFNASIMTLDRLDYIFVNRSVHVKKYGVLTDSFREITSDKRFTLPNFPEEIVFRECSVRLPSDHYPVMVQIEL